MGHPESDKIAKHYLALLFLDVDADIDHQNQKVDLVGSDSPAGPSCCYNALAAMHMGSPCRLLGSSNESRVGGGGKSGEILLISSTLLQYAFYAGKFGKVKSRWYLTICRRVSLTSFGKRCNFDKDSKVEADKT